MATDPLVIDGGGGEMGTVGSSNRGDGGGMGAGGGMVGAGSETVGVGGGTAGVGGGTAGVVRAIGDGEGGSIIAPPIGQAGMLDSNS